MAKDDALLLSIRNMLNLGENESDSCVLESLQKLAAERDKLAQRVREQEMRMHTLRQYPVVVEQYAGQLERIAEAFKLGRYVTYEHLTTMLEEVAKTYHAKDEIATRVCGVLGIPTTLDVDYVVNEVDRLKVQSSIGIVELRELLRESQKITEHAAEVLEVLGQQAAAEREAARPSMDELYARMLSSLNTAFEADPAAIRSLLTIRIPCTQEMAEHPCMIVESNAVIDGGPSDIGVLGFLNGVVMAAGFPAISVKWTDQDEDGRSKILGFCEYASSKYDDDIS